MGRVAPAFVFIIDFGFVYWVLISISCRLPLESVIECDTRGGLELQYCASASRFVLLSNSILGPSVFVYATSNCIRISGWKFDSVTGIQYRRDSSSLSVLAVVWDPISKPNPGQMGRRYRYSISISSWGSISGGSSSLFVLGVIWDPISNPNPGQMRGRYRYSISISLWGFDIGR